MPQIQHYVVTGLLVRGLLRGQQRQAAACRVLQAHRSAGSQGARAWRGGQGAQRRTPRRRGCRRQIRDLAQGNRRRVQRRSEAKARVKAGSGDNKIKGEAPAALQPAGSFLSDPPTPVQQKGLQGPPVQPPSSPQDLSPGGLVPAHPSHFLPRNTRCPLPLGRVSCPPCFCPCRSYGLDALPSDLLVPSTRQTPPTMRSPRPPPWGHMRPHPRNLPVCGQTLCPRPAHPRSVITDWEPASPSSVGPALGTY